ncbi:MAG: hypothetical protein JST12_14765 [Armatimonadetes bacterium]|nr:hypothetical protein [Armatimonadota bacterium]
MSLKVFVDHAQRRLWKHRIGVTLAGIDWAGGHGVNIWREPTTNTLLIEPYCLSDAWSTSTTGGYARWGLSDFGLSTGDGWYTKSDKQASQNRMANQAPMGSSAISTTSLVKNQGVWVSFFNFNEGDKELVVFECGWSDSGDGTSGVSLRFFAGGRVEVWKDNVKRSTENLNGIASRNNANHYVNLVLMPFRRRELLVYSSTAGGGFTYLFSEIDEQESDPEITPATKFWFKALISPDVEIAPLRFPTTAWGVSKDIVFANIPETGRAIESIWNHGHPLYLDNSGIVYADKSYSGAGGTESISDLRLVETTSDSTTFVPDGVKNKARMRFDLTGNGYSSPCFYGAHVAFVPVYATTADAEVEITSFVCSPPEWTVPDSATGVNIRLEFNRLDELGAIAPKIEKIRNRPVRIELDGVTILDGYLNGLKVSGDSNDRRLECQAEDIFSWAQKCQITSRMPFDGLPFCRPIADGISAVGFLMSYLGIPTDRIILDDADFTIPFVPAQKAETFGVVGENGDTIARCAEKLQELFAKGWMYGQKPYVGGAANMPVIFWTDPVNFPTTPVKTLYCSPEAAVAAEVPSADIRESIFDNPSTDAIDVEANEVRVSGNDPRIDLAIQAVKTDEASQDPATLPADRPDNWAGSPLLVGVLDGRFTSQLACERAAAFGFDLITKANYVTEFPCFLIQDVNCVPAWRGDLAVLTGYDYDQARITSFRCTFEDESDTDTVDNIPIHSRYATYTGGTMYNQGGTGLRSIMENARTKSVDRSVKGSKSEEVVYSLVSIVHHV